MCILTILVLKNIIRVGIQNWQLSTFWSDHLSSSLTYVTLTEVFLVKIHTLQVENGAQNSQKLFTKGFDSQVKPSVQPTVLGLSCTHSGPAHPRVTHAKACVRPGTVSRGLCPHQGSGLRSHRDTFTESVRAGKFQTGLDCG